MIKFYTFVPSSGPVVQWIEYQIPILRVVGSSPAGVTRNKKPCKLTTYKVFLSVKQIAKVPRYESV